MPHAEENNIRHWMKLNYQNFISATELAENCAWRLNHDEWLDDSGHIIWDIAVEFLED